MITGIIGAMRVEVDALKAKMENAVCERVGGIEMVRGRLSGKEVVVAQCGIGKVFAAMCAQTMILRYGVGRIINTGIAGSLSGELGILDMVVANGVVQHDMDTSPIGDPVGLISGINLVKIASDGALGDELFLVAQKMGLFCRRGVIASGDQFINDADKKAWIAKTFDAVACEMEGAAIGQVCYVNGVDFAIVRSISDNASGEAEMEYPEMAARAAVQSEELLLAFLAE